MRLCWCSSVPASVNRSSCPGASTSGSPACLSIQLPCIDTAGWVIVHVRRRACATRTPRLDEREAAPARDRLKTPCSGGAGVGVRLRSIVPPSCETI